MIKADTLVALTKNEIELIGGGQVTPEKIIEEIGIVESIAQAIEKAAEQLGIPKQYAVTMGIGSFAGILLLGTGWYIYSKSRTQTVIKAD